MSSEIDNGHPTVTDVAILNDLFAKYKNKDKWRIIPERPTFTRGWADASIRIYFPDDRSVRAVRIASVMYWFSKVDWAAIISHIKQQFAGTDTTLRIPSQFRNSYVLVGDAGHSSSRAKVKELIKEYNELPEDERYLKGFIYSMHQKIRYDAAKLLRPNRIFFEAPFLHSMIAHDCCGHSVNYLVRDALFVRREQLQRLATLRSKKSFEVVASHKIAGGYHLSIFRDFFVKGGRSYSINHLVSFSFMQQKDWRHLT